VNEHIKYLNTMYDCGLLNTTLQAVHSPTDERVR